MLGPRFRVVTRHVRELPGPPAPAIPRPVPARRDRSRVILWLAAGGLCARTVREYERVSCAPAAHGIFFARRVLAAHARDSRMSRQLPVRYPRVWRSAARAITPRRDSRGRRLPRNTSICASQEPVSQIAWIARPRVWGLSRDVRRGRRRSFCRAGTPPSDERRCRSWDWPTRLTPRVFCLASRGSGFCSLCRSATQKPIGPCPAAAAPGMNQVHAAGPAAPSGPNAASVVIMPAPAASLRGPACRRPAGHSQSRVPAAPVLDWRNAPPPVNAHAGVA